jgi:arsenite methyltransferase
MSDANPQGEIKVCCATFYESDAVRLLLGDVFHPGGLALTAHLGQVIGLQSGDHCLDVACGRGASALHLAQQFGCRVTGVDYGAENIAAAQSLAAEKEMAHLATFRQGDAEKLPLDDGTFDAVISECSFCTFPDKPIAAAEIARVLCPGGRLGLTDMTVNDPLPDDIQNLLSWVACVTGALKADDYVATLRAAGFSDFVVEDQSEALLDMVQNVRRCLLGVELAVKLGKISLGGLNLDEGKRLGQRAVELIEGNVVSYALIAARKG